jgi:hypothetical protein
LSEQNSKYLERPSNRSDRPGKMQENQWPRNPVLTFWQSKRICSDNARSSVVCGGDANAGCVRPRHSHGHAHHAVHRAGGLANRDDRRRTAITSLSFGRRDHRRRCGDHAPAFLSLAASEVLLLLGGSHGGDSYSSQKIWK